MISADREIMYVNEYELSFIDYFRAIQYCAYRNGFDITLKEASEIWDEVSDKNFCSFMSYKIDDMEGLWKYIKEHFPPSLNDTPEWITKYENKTTSFYIGIEIVKKKSSIQSGLEEQRRVLGYTMDKEVVAGLTVGVITGLDIIIREKTQKRLPVYQLIGVWKKYASHEFNTMCQSQIIDDVWSIVQPSIPVEEI